MPSLLRKIAKSKWREIENPLYSSNADLPADTLTDLLTKDNKLSVWRIEDNGSNLKRVVTAIISKCNYISNFDYSQIDFEFLSRTGVKIEKSPGDTKDRHANESWHYNLKDLSVLKVVALAKEIAKNPLERFTEKDICKWMKQAVDNQHIDKATLNSNITKHLE